MGIGFPQPGGGGAQTVNGIPPDGAGNIAIGATDIPYTPTFATQATTGNPSTSVGGQLLWDETHKGTTVWAWGEPTIEAAAPVGDVTPDKHTIGQSVILTPPLGGAPISLTSGNGIDVVSPGALEAFGMNALTITGDTATPLIDGEVNARNFNVLNTNGGGGAADVRTESLASRPVLLQSVFSFGFGGVIFDDVTGSAIADRVALFPPAPGAAGLSVDGTVGQLLILNSFAVAPGGTDYAAVTLESSATVAALMGVIGFGFVSQRPGDSVASISLSATVPSGPLPTDNVGLRFANDSIQGDGVMFDPSGLTSSSIEVSSFGHLNGPRSNWIGDGRLDTAGPPPDALLDHTSSPGLPLTVPADNAQNGGAGGTLRVMGLTASVARHSLLLGLVNAVSVNAGGTYTGDGNFPATQASTSGSGVGAEFTVTVAGGTVTAVVSIDELGEDYEIGDTITLLVVGPTETVAAVLDVDDITWLLRTDGPVNDLTGTVRWLVDHERQGAAGSVVLGYIERRKAGAGAWVEVPNTRSLPQALTNVPTRADADTNIDDIGVGDEWRIAWVNDVGGSAGTLFTIIELVVEGQP